MAVVPGSMEEWKPQTTESGRTSGQTTDRGGEGSSDGLKDVTDQRLDGVEGDNRKAKKVVDALFKGRKKGEANFMDLNKMKDQSVTYYVWSMNEKK